MTLLSFSYLGDPRQNLFEFKFRSFLSLLSHFTYYLFFLNVNFFFLIKFLKSKRTNFCASGAFKGFTNARKVDKSIKENGEGGGRKWF